MCQHGGVVPSLECYKRLERIEAGEGGWAVIRSANQWVLGNDCQSSFGGAGDHEARLQGKEEWWGL